MESIKIKEFIPEDRHEDKKALLPVFLEIWNSPENLKYLSQTLTLFDPTIAQNWLENHKALGGRYFCALNDHGEIMGVLVIKVDPLDGFEIYGIGVIPMLKGKGVGRKLIRHAVLVAQELGFKAINTLVFADNAAMLCLLLKNDFIPIGMEYHKRADGADAVILKRCL